MVSLAQLVRASACGAEGHGFEPHTGPKIHGVRSSEEEHLIVIQKVGISKFLVHPKILKNEKRI